MLRRFFTYILTNKNKTVLYVGVTNDLAFRIEQHTDDALNNRPTFAAKYKCVYLLYFEEYQIAQHAISREKEIKSMTRDKKIALIKTMNPEFQFLNYQEAIK
jgi:putative endonuclease